MLCTCAKSRSAAASEEGVNVVLGLGQSRECCPEQVVELLFVERHCSRPDAAIEYRVRRKAMGRHQGLCFGDIENRHLDAASSRSEQMQFLHLLGELRGYFQTAPHDVSQNAAIHIVLFSFVWMLIGPDPVESFAVNLDMREKHEAETACLIHGLSLLSSIAQPVQQCRHRYSDQNRQDAARSLDPRRPFRLGEARPPKRIKLPAEALYRFHEFSLIQLGEA